MGDKNDNPHDEGPNAAGGPGGSTTTPAPRLDEQSYFKQDLFYKKFGAVVSIGGFVLILGGLLATCRQVSINTEQLRLNTEQSKTLAKAQRAGVTNSTVGHVLRLDEVFLARPYLTPYFYEGKPLDAKDERYLEVSAAAVMTLDVFDVLGNQNKHYPEFWDTPAAWDEWMIDVFANSPVLRETLDGHRNWYGERMFELRRRGQARMEENAAKARRPGT